MRALLREKVMYNKNKKSYYNVLATFQCMHVLSILQSNLPLCLLLDENIRMG